MERARSLSCCKKRIKGSYPIFSRGADKILKLQPDGSKAKDSQVKQVRQIIIERKLASDGEDK